MSLLLQFLANWLPWSRLEPINFGVCFVRFSASLGGGGRGVKSLGEFCDGL